MAGGVDDDQDDYFLTRELLSEVPGGRFHLDWTPEYAAGREAVCAGKHDAFLVDVGEQTELIRGFLASTYRDKVQRA